jgi:hypothetical protein
MSDDPKDVIEFAIRSAFLCYPKEDDPDWRSPHWIKPKECAHCLPSRALRLRCAAAFGSNGVRYDMVRARRKDT